MAFTSIKIEQARSSEPLVTFKKNHIAFNAVFVREAFGPDKVPQTVDIQLDEESRKIAFRFDKPGFKLQREAGSKGVRMISATAFKAMPWAVDGKYVPIYDKKLKLWIISMPKVKADK